MIKSIEVINYLNESIKINLSDSNPEHGMIITNIDGLGSPKANINTTNYSSIDGSLFNSARIGNRNIVINMLFTFTPTIEDSRQRTYKYFPLKKPLTFIVETDNRIVKTVGYVESNEPDIFSNNESNQISILCPDPYFYSIGSNTTVLFGTEPLFEFEFENDSTNNSVIEFGSIEDFGEKPVYYEGDSEIGIIITIHALDDVGTITLYNTRTKETMKINANKIQELTGEGIIAGDDIIISTIRGNKKLELLRDGIYINILNALDKSSDWFQLVQGVNVFTYTTEYGSENLQLKIENQFVYEGV